MEHPRHDAAPRLVPAILGVLVEVAAFFPVGDTADLLSNIGSSPQRAITLHVLAAILTGLAFPGWCGWRAGQGPHRLGPLTIATSLCLPIVGCLCGLVVATLRRLEVQIEVSLIQDYRDFVERLRLQRKILPDVRGQILDLTARSMELRPFLEILSNRASTGSAISAIQGLSHLEPSVASRLLRFALKSGVPETRYYAARALGQIEESLEREFQEAELALRQNPSDMETKLRVAGIRFRYGMLGESDDPVARFHMNEASLLYEECLLTVDPARRREVQESLAQSLKLLGRVQESKRHFCELVDSGSVAPSVCAGAVEACYLDGDLVRMSRYLRIAMERCPDSETIHHVARAWPLEADGTHG